MRQLSLITALLLAATPLAAADDGHHHLTEADGLRVVHAWTPATSGPEALIYMEIENRSDAAVTLTGAETADGQRAELVGFTYTDGTEAWQVLPEMPLAAGQHLDLLPRTLALRLTGLATPLTKGDEIDLELSFSDQHLDVHVAVEDAGATGHSHAGHTH
ncbi:copper chaperone PCu(A)C [Tabrizicola sp. WMC-M-20]|nr:copper chaperone PCu(A)C [Tabrizicola sp. WMC-M-20]